ncbi:MAG: phosphoenolpyruvate--protein phosphotransferase [Planctomycetota bacterium]|nr:MAG: phosphoenolpyruvate--protein phosphotransferase [Planctomycetota bacterium]
MKILQGIPVSPGYRVRTAYLLNADGIQITEKTFSDPSRADAEKERFLEAVESSKAELYGEKERLRALLGQDMLQILVDYHLTLLDDKNMREEVITRIGRDLNTPEYALSLSLRRSIKALQGSDNEYLRQRVADLKDFETRLQRHLQGLRQESMSDLPVEVVIVARDLTPAQTVGLDRNKVVGFVTESGGPTSHTAILAKGLGIPAVVAVNGITNDILGGETIIIDGVKGKVMIDPNAKTRAEYEALEEEYNRAQVLLRTEFRYLPAETIDGRRMRLYANVEFPQEVDSAFEYGAAGIGLYRTEFLYTGRRQIPDEESQFKVYREAAEKFKNRSVVIRTLDLGADKIAEEVSNIKEMNPYLGWRSIRLCLGRPEIFRPQIAAILRAGAYGNVKMLLPMISTLEELGSAKRVIESVKDDLRKRKVTFNPDISIGAMIEVPSAALQAEGFADEVDFFSIGTNDLIQYTLAVDRINERVANLYQPTHPSVLELIRQVIDVGAQRKVEVTLCGEMGGDPLMTLLLIGMGLRDLSITPMAIIRIKQIIRNITFRHAREVAHNAMKLSTAGDIENYLREELAAIST